MEASEKARFDQLYQHHLRALKLRGMSDSTIDVYARAVRRVAQHYDCCPDRLTIEQLVIRVGAGFAPGRGSLFCRAGRVAFLEHGQGGPHRSAIFLAIRAQA